MNTDPSGQLMWLVHTKSVGSCVRVGTRPGWVGEVLRLWIWELAGAGQAAGDGKGLSRDGGHGLRRGFASQPQPEPAGQACLAGEEGLVPALRAWKCPAAREW